MSTMRNALLTALALLLATTLSGCTDDADGAEGQIGTEPVLAPLHGWVFDAAIRPLTGVSLEVLETGANTTTDGNGYYQFLDLPADQSIILVAKQPGFQSGSKQVTLPPDRAVRLNFTLEPVPVKVPRNEVLEFNGLTACASAVAVDEDEYVFDCSFGAPQNNVWEFSVGPDLAGAVIEIAWEPGHPAATSFVARLETLGLGELNTELAEARGESVLRLQVPESVAVKYYPEGGHMRLTVLPGPDTGAQEAGIGAVVLFQQDFEAFASLFYVQGPDPAYTIQGV